jgi:hypothetical protein
MKVKRKKMYWWKEDERPQLTTIAAVESKIDRAFSLAVYALEKLEAMDKEPISYRVRPDSRDDEGMSA